MQQLTKLSDKDFKNGYEFVDNSTLLAKYY